MPRRCEVADCDRIEGDYEIQPIIVTDRDGGGTPMDMCTPCYNAYRLGQND